MLRSRRFALVLGAAAVLGFAWPVSHATAQAPPDEKLPSAESLLQKMVKAMGGEAAMRKHKFRLMKGTFSVPSAGIEGDLVVHEAAPNLRLAVIDIPQFNGQIQNGFDGETAWRDGPPAGPTIIEGKMRDQAVFQADFYSTLNYKKYFKDIETVAKSNFNGATCYDLKMTSKDGDERHLFIDADTYRLAGNTGTLSTPQGDLPVQTTYEDYKEFDGVQIAVKTRSDIGGVQEQIITIDDVSFEPFDLDIFDLPDSIKALKKDADKP